VALNLTHRHAAGVHAQNLVIEAIEPRLAFGDQLRLKAARAVARDRDIDFAIFGQDRFRTRSVAAVAAAAPGRVALRVAEMLGQLSTESTLDQGLLQLFEKSPPSPVRSSGFS
jgi:hypothetical protein